MSSISRATSAWILADSPPSAAMAWANNSSATTCSACPQSENHRILRDSVIEERRPVVVDALGTDARAGQGVKARGKGSMIAVPLAGSVVAMSCEVIAVSRHVRQSGGKVSSVSPQFVMKHVIERLGHEDLAYYV